MTTAVTLRSAVLVLVAAGLLVGAVVLASGVRGFVARSQTAPGVVTRLLAGPSHPEVRFTTAAGEAIDTPQGGLIFGYAAGRPVRVRYDAAAPRASARLDSPGSLWGPTLLLAGVGLMVLAAGVVPLRRSLRPLPELGSAPRKAA